MEQDDALLAAWKETLAHKGDAPAVLNTRGEVVRSFSQIEEEAQKFARKIDMFASGGVLAVQIGNDDSWPAIFLASLRRRLVVLPLEQTISEAQRDAVFKTSGVVAAAISRGRDVEILPPGTAAATTRFENGISLLKLTSGTTAQPRVVQFTSRQLLTDCAQICDTMGIRAVDLNFGVISISHSYGFSNLLTPLLARAVPMVLSGDRTPRAVLDDLAKTEATVFPGTPLLFQALAEIEQQPRVPKLRLCISAGAPLPREVATKFRAEFNQRIHSFYGASECGGICYDRDGLDEIDGYVGEAMKGVDLALLEPEAEVSQVRVRSAAVGAGYFPASEPDKLGDGVFTPDDLLAKCGKGFRVAGRLSDVINVAGKKVHPAEIEALLRNVPGVREVVAFGRESPRRHEEVAACVVVEAGLSESQLLEFCRQRLASWQVPRRIFVVDQIPVSERGKVSRRELARRFA